MSVGSYLYRKFIGVKVYKQGGYLSSTWVLPDFEHYGSKTSPGLGGEICLKNAQVKNKVFTQKEAHGPMM